MAVGVDSSREGLDWVVEDVLAREDAIRSAREDDLWDRFVVQLPLGAATVDLRIAVLANMVALLSVDDQADRETLRVLVHASDHETVAQLQQECLAVLGDEPDHQLATELVLRLFPGVIVAAADAVRWQDVLDTGAIAALHLLLVGVEAPGGVAGLDGLDDADHPEIESVGDLVKIMSEGGIDEWRRYLAAITANPVSRYPMRLKRLAQEAGHPIAAAAVEALTVIQRQRFEEAERRDVADEIRRLIGLSGLSQRRFAEMVGTSPSRLSTYVTGAVTPSAAMLLRISRVARTLARRGAASAPGTSGRRGTGTGAGTAEIAADAEG